MITDIKYESKQNGFIDKYLDDTFFDSLRKDYAEFNDWYKKSVHDPRKNSHYWFKQENLIAFLGFKVEDEAIEIGGIELPRKKRLKITTIKSTPGYIKSFSEFIIYESSKKARNDDIKEIYFSIIPNTFEKQKLLDIAVTYGFKQIGTTKNSSSGNKRSENEIYLLKKLLPASEDWKVSYPYLASKKNSIRLWTIMALEHLYHDTYIQDADLSNTPQIRDFTKMTIKKIYLHNQYELNDLRIGSGLLIYRKSPINPGNKSCVTAYGALIDKYRKSEFTTFDEFKKFAKNYHAFTSEDELKKWYNDDKKKFISVFSLNKTLGKGNNINHNYLRENGYWPDGKYPTSILLRDNDILKLLKETDNV